MARVSTYLSFDGQTEEAFNLYQAAFGTKFAFIQRMGEVPPRDGQPEMSEEDKKLVMHVDLPILGDHHLMGSDGPGVGGVKIEAGNNISINLEPDTREEVDRLFAALSEGGSADMPPREEFWGAYFGACTDKFGVKWMFNCQTE